MKVYPHYVARILSLVFGDVVCICFGPHLRLANSLSEEEEEEEEDEQNSLS